MKRLKQAAAAALAVTVAASALSGCSSTDYSMTVNGEKINAGVYINFMVNEMTTQMYTLYYGGEITDPSECFDKQIDGKDFTAYVKDEALQNTKEFAAVNAKFDELGLSLSDEDKDAVKSSVSSSWEQSEGFYENIGISKESLTQCTELSYKRQAIFDHYYAEGGEEEVADDEIQSFVNENYIRYKNIVVPKSTAEDEEEKEAENAELNELIEGYLAEAETLDFYGFDTIIDEYDAYKEAQAAETETADGGEGDEESAVTELDSSSSADTDSPDSAADTSDDSAADDSAADAETELDSSSAADADGEESEEEEDPYANETVVNYTDATDEDSESYSETNAEMLEEYKNAEYGKAARYETEDYYYLYITEDIAERTDYVEDNKDSLLQTIKGDEFEEKIKSWVESLKITVNDKAIKRYAVKDVYDRQNDYYSSNSN